MELATVVITRLPALSLLVYPLSTATGSYYAQRKFSPKIDRGRRESSPSVRAVRTSTVRASRDDTVLLQEYLVPGTLVRVDLLYVPVLVTVPYYSMTVQVITVRILWRVCPSPHHSFN